MGISFFYNEKRFRFFNSSVIGENFNPNICDESLKEKQHDLLYQSFFIKLESDAAENPAPIIAMFFINN